ncbi:MAG: hypothetical protein ABIR46_00530 [Candidatus Saccharimonadales bacterium]
MPDDFQSKSMLKEIDRALEKGHFDRALGLAHECYDKDRRYKGADLMLLSITFSATIQWGARLDLENKKLAQELWQQATRSMNLALKSEAANHAIRLAEIYLARREINLAWNALRVAKDFVVFGPLSLRYNKAVDAYVKLSGRSDSDLWIN